jgi:hypothetical protein
VAGESKIGAKTMTLSLRLDPKTRFILEFVARIKGQSITTVVERAIKETADGLSIGEILDERGIVEHQFTWIDFWDSSEGVRTLGLLNFSDYPTTFDEDELKAFTRVHWPFFYVRKPGGELNRDYIEILWPNVHGYLEIWRQKKRIDYWAAGAAMTADLEAAKVVPPAWPPQSEPPVDPADIEIPF